MRRKTGSYRTTATSTERVRAFVPAPLPPDPPVRLDGPLQRVLERANLALGRLDGISGLLPDPALFLYSYVRKEAVLSSQIEGTRSSISNLLLFELAEAPGVPLDEVGEVSNQVAAFDHGLRRRREGFPLSNRLIREMHGVLLSRGRGSSKNPGEFRRSQVWIGGSRPGSAAFVPPPFDAVPDCMSALERFLHDEDDDLPVLVRAALAHVQFETIHPFLDGNGRIGRLLVTLLLCHARRAPGTAALPQPLSQKASRGLLRAAQRGSADRRLGSLDRLLSGGRPGGRRARGGRRRWALADVPGPSGPVDGRGRPAARAR